jgi:hypothetical protein
MANNGNHDGDARPLARGPNGQFLKGNRGGPGSPLARQAVSLRSTWLEAGRKVITPQVAERIIQNAVRISLEGENDRDQLAASTFIVQELGLSLKRPDESERADGITYLLNVSFADKKPPPDFIDHPQELWAARANRAISAEPLTRWRLIHWRGFRNTPRTRRVHSTRQAFQDSQ